MSSLWYSVMALDLCRAEHTVVSRSGKLGLGDTARRGAAPCCPQHLVGAEGSVAQWNSMTHWWPPLEKDSERLNTFWLVGVFACDRGHLVQGLISVTPSSCSASLSPLGLPESTILLLTQNVNLTALARTRGLSDRQHYGRSCHRPCHRRCRSGLVRTPDPSLDTWWGMAAFKQTRICAHRRDEGGI
jgi:hypothetical protein